MKTFKKGDKVKVYNRTPSGKKFLEGVAIVKRKSDCGGMFYHVCFESDGCWGMRNLNEAELVK